MELWLDGQPTGSQLAIYANSTAMHLSMGHTWAWCEGIAPGSHTIALLAGTTTITDLNDRACVTVWEMGDGCAVRFAEDAPCPPGVGDVLLKGAAEIYGGDLLVAAGASGWSGQGGVIGASVETDGSSVALTEVFANSSGMHLATVPVATVVQGVPRGSNSFAITAEGATATDGGDIAHLAVVEWVDPQQAPAVLGMSPQLQNAAGSSQDGDGGAVAQSSFQSSGGTLLVSVSASGWTPNSGGGPLQIGVQLDGTSQGFLEIFANDSDTHMAMVTNDLVVSGIAAGDHTLTLIGEANTHTDLNDRVSATILEFPAG